MSEIIVKTLTGKIIPLIIDLTTITVNGLKEGILEKSGIEPRNQRLVFSGRKIEEDGRTLSELGITSGSTIHLILRLRCNCYHLQLNEEDYKQVDESLVDPDHEEKLRKEMFECFNFKDESEYFQKFSRSRKKIIRDVKKCYKYRLPELLYIRTLDNENILEWEVALSGPTGSFYEGGTFVLIFKAPIDYPFKPFVVDFQTKIFHPMFTQTSKQSCGLIKKDDWSPYIDMFIVIRKIVKEMKDIKINEDSVVNQLVEKAKELLEEGKIEEFGRIARLWTKWYANGLVLEEDEEIQERTMFCCENFNVIKIYLGSSTVSNLNVSKVFLFL